MVCSKNPLGNAKESQVRSFYSFCSFCSVLSCPVLSCLVLCLHEKNICLNYSVCFLFGRIIILNCPRRVPSSLPAPLVVSFPLLHLNQRGLPLPVDTLTLLYSTLFLPSFLSVTVGFTSWSTPTSQISFARSLLLLLQPSLIPSLSQRTIETTTPRESAENQQRDRESNHSHVRKTPCTPIHPLK